MGSTVTASAPGRELIINLKTAMTG